MDQRELVERAQRGDRDAFAVLAGLFVARLDAAARLILRDHELARDAVQEGYLRAWRNLPSLRDPDRFEAWLRSLVSRSCIDVLRRRGRRPIEVELLPVDGPAVADFATVIADRDLLELALRRLQPEQRAVIVLHYYLGMPLPDVAAALGIPVGTAKSRHHRSLALMRAAIDADPDAGRVAGRWRAVRMTAFDRVERHLPELFDELAGAGIPDYFDDMLRPRRRLASGPAWSNPERWLPMGVIALPAPTRRLPLRYLALAVAVLLLLTAALVYVGSRRVACRRRSVSRATASSSTRTADGDLAAWDPVTGTTKTIINGTDSSAIPGLLARRDPPGVRPEADRPERRDGPPCCGRRLQPSRLRHRTEHQVVRRVGVGSTGRSSRRIVGATVVQSMVDMATGHETPLDVDPALGITMGIFRPGHDQVIYEHVPNDGVHGTTIYLAHGDGTGPLHQIPIAADAVNEAWPSPDGKTLVYSSWGTGFD